MTSVVEICNLALSNIRSGSINSLTESSLQAQQCKLKYPILRDQVLSDASWQFARKTKALALTTLTTPEWVYVYQYPSDCLVVTRIIPNYALVDSTSITPGSTGGIYGEVITPNTRDQVPYEVQNIDGNRVILCNQADVYIEYRAKIEDPNLFTPSFILALGHLLGAEIAIPIVGADVGAGLRRESYQLYTQYITSAQVNNQNEQYHVKRQSDFVNVRK